MKKIKTVVDLLGEDLVIQHISSSDYSLKVKLAMILSDQNNGVITTEDEDAINAQPS